MRGEYFHGFGSVLGGDGLYILRLRGGLGGRDRWGIGELGERNQFRGKWFIFCVFNDWFGLGGGFCAVGLDGLELFQGVSVVALVGGDAALGSAEGFGASNKGQAQILSFIGGEIIVQDGAGGGHVAAAEPFGANEIVDEAAFFGGFGVEAVVIFGDESVVVFAAFGGDDVGFGVEAGFDGVLR